MITYFPTLYPDELVYSWFCRYYVHSGFFSSKAAMQELYCKRSDSPSKEFIGNLNSDARKQISKLHSLRELILNHTMYPQYARFIPLEQKNAALYRLEHDSCDVHYLFSILPRTDGEQFLRYCPRCAQEDRETYGETYWHRKHQIRNTRICPKHKCRLAESGVPAKSEQSFTFCPAEQSILCDKVIFEENQLVVRYAAYLESVFDTPMNFETDIPVCSVLYDGMSRTKYLKPSGRSRYTKMLADDLNGFCKSLKACSIASIHQIQRVLLGDRFDFSVVCQIAFFLGMDSEALTSPNLTMEQVQQEQNSHYMKNSAPFLWLKRTKKQRASRKGTPLSKCIPQIILVARLGRSLHLSGGNLHPSIHTVTKTVPSVLSPAIKWYPIAASIISDQFPTSISYVVTTVLSFFALIVLLSFAVIAKKRFVKREFHYAKPGHKMESCFLLFQ